MSHDYIELDTSSQSDTPNVSRFKERMNSEIKDSMQLLLNNHYQLGTADTIDAFMHVYTGSDKFELVEKMKVYLTSEKSRWNNWDVKQEHQ